MTGNAPSGARRRVRRRRAVPGLALAAAVVLAIVAPVAALVPSAPAAAATTDLTITGDASYDVRPDSRLVHVTVALTARNRTSETTARRFYFDSGYLALPAGASALKIAGANGAKGATVSVSRRTTSSTLVRIGFGGHLYSGQSRAFTLAFDLRDPGGAAGRPMRISSSLAILPVWAFASAGAAGSTVSVTIPPGYEVTVLAGSFDHAAATAAGGRRLWTDKLATPLTFFANVLAERTPVTADTVLAVTTSGSQAALTLRAWADDPAWAKRMGDLLGRALPSLSAGIGLPWPAGSPTVIAESVSQTTGSDAGRYDPATGRIEIAYWADPLVTIHEAAHGWFNGSLVADRWAAEGFAALYAERTATALKVGGASPKLTAKLLAARIPLNGWSSSGTVVDRAIEGYGFAASLEVARRIAAQIGDDALRAVWADAAGRVGAYQPPAASFPDAAPGSVTPEPAPAAADWRGLLDLIEARSGKDLSDLFRTWIVTPEQAPLLDTRTVARMSYARTLALAGDWALPVSIREALRAWQFDRALALLADARTVVAQRTAVEARAARMGLALPASVRRLFEAGAFSAASTEAEAENDAMLAIRGATAAAPADPDPITRIGLLGTDPAGDLETARMLLADGSVTGATTAATSATATWAGAWVEGRRRAVLAVAAIAGLLLVLSLATGRRRRGRGHARPAPSARRVRPA